MKVGSSLRPALPSSRTARDRSDRTAPSHRPHGESGGMSAAQDSELAHAFGPQEIGFDFLPLEAPGEPPLPTRPAAAIPTCDLSGNEPLPELGGTNGRLHASPPAANGRNRNAGEIWLDGESIFCACPDCRAPMSIRFWLMVADCWRCGASIELSEEQEREVQRLLAERDQVGEGERAGGAVSPPACRRATRSTFQRESTARNASTPPSPSSPPPAPPPAARQAPRPPAARPPAAPLLLHALVHSTPLRSGPPPLSKSSAASRGCGIW